MDVESLKQRNKELFDNFILYDTRSVTNIGTERRRNGTWRRRNRKSLVVQRERET